MNCRSILLALLVTLSAGCAREHHAWFARTRSIYRPPKKDRGQTVILTEGRPNRPYHDIGVITAQAGSYHDVLYYAQKLGARIGCDAIVPLGSAVIATGAYRTFEGAQVVHEVRSRFSCLVWP